MHGLAPAVTAHNRTNPHISSMAGGARRQAMRQVRAICRTFPWRRTRPGGTWNLSLEGRHQQGVRVVLTYRLATGFGGLIFVAMILFLVQMISGIRTFPL